MRSWLMLWLLVVGLWGWESRPAWAQGFLARWWHAIATDFRRNNCWPQPFVYPNRAAVRVPLQMVVDRGWQRHNTLGAEYFDPETQALNHAGRLKVRWILTQAPLDRRVVYLNPGPTAQITQARLAAVRKEVAAYVSRRQLDEHLVLTPVPEAQWPGADITAIGQRFQASQPAPVLPQQSTTEED